MEVFSNFRRSPSYVFMPKVVTTLTQLVKYREVYTGLVPSADCLDTFDVSN